VNTNLKEYFEITNNFIDDALDNDEKILIHCMVGRSRSVTILAAYIMKITGMNVENTLKSIKNKRSMIEPNEYFILQLEGYYKELRNK
jgi:protein-tyrosine phosphatase